MRKLTEEEKSQLQLKIQQQEPQRQQITEQKGNFDEGVDYQFEDYAGLIRRFVIIV